MSVRAKEYVRLFDKLAPQVGPERARFLLIGHTRKKHRAKGCNCFAHRRRRARDRIAKRTEKHREASLAYARRNREAHNERNRQWRLKNPERQKALTARWRKRQAEKVTHHPWSGTQKTE